MSEQQTQPVSQDLLTLVLPKDIKYPECKQLKKHLEEYADSVLVREVFCRGRFLLVKIASPDYSALLSSTDAYKWIVGRVIDIYEKGIVKLECETDKTSKSSQLLLQLEKDNGWSILPKIITTAKAQWIETLLKTIWRLMKNL